MMKTMSAREAKHAFGLTVATARKEPVLIEKHERAVVVVVSVEKFGHLQCKAIYMNVAPTKTKERG